ncbi:MAG: CoA-binding protein, partial [Acidobacteriota bacterium]
MKELTDRDDIRQTLAEARTVAVLGAHVEPSKPAHYVPDYLHGQGYRILPVNP